MSIEAQAVFFGLALACFILAALGIALSPRLNLVALGLALWVFISFYIAFKAADF